MRSSANRYASSYICARCMSKRNSRLYSTDNLRKAPAPPPSSGAAKLQNRSLISLLGPDTPKFLQGIITNNVNPGNRIGFYAAFLTAPGKVLHDVFIYPTLGSQWHKERNPGDSEEDVGYLIEVDSEQRETLLKHLKRHKLRSKLKIRSLDDGELDVWSVWREGDRWTAHGQPQASRENETILGVTDCRAPGMGQRLLVPSTGINTILEEMDEAPISAYTIRRYVRGVAEGQQEMPRDDCLPMNCNIDIMGGIDFKKGCYLGQELTIRTHHTGVVRRRILPILLYGKDQPPPHTLEYDPSFEPKLSEQGDRDIRRDDERQRKTGHVIASVGNVGLGMCRLEQMSDLTISGEGSSYTPDDRFMVLNADDGKFGLKAFVPDWIRGNIREPKIQRRVQ